MLELVQRRKLIFPNEAELRTPLLLPSFSGRVSKTAEIVETASDFIDGPILISAYDVYHERLKNSCDWAGAIFLDSGGYEIEKGSDLSDVSDEPSGEEAWSREEHADVLSKWNLKVPLVVISYDHPRDRADFGQQIANARALQLPANALREILLKPETVDQRFLNRDNLERAVKHLKNFDVVGVTEKEIGNSVEERMINIARLRRIGPRGPQYADSRFRELGHHHNAVLFRSWSRCL